MNNKQLIGVLGVVLLAIGAFSPILHIPIMGSITYIQNGKGDGVFILFFAILASYYLFKERYISVRVTGFASLAVLLFTFINFQMKLTDIQSKLNKDMAGNPFKGITDLAMQSIYLEWGFAVVLVGALMLILSSFIKNVQNELDNHHFAEAQSEDIQKPRSTHTLQAKAEQKATYLSQQQQELKNVQSVKNETNKEIEKDIQKPRSTHTSQIKVKQAEQKTTHLSQQQQEFRDAQPVKNETDKEMDKILTSMQTTTQESQNQNEDKAHIKNHRTKNMYTSKHSSDESFLKKHGFLLVIVLIIIINAILYLSGTSDNDGSDVKYEVVEREISNSYKDQMGWGKASTSAQIQPVNIRVGKMLNSYSDKFTYPTPAIELSVKNIGDNNLRSFGINFEVKDIANKRRIGRIAVASGSIDSGWTGKRHVLSLSPNDFAKLIGNNPIDFKMLLNVYVLLDGEKVIKLYEGTIEPKELKALPIISY